MQFPMQQATSASTARRSNSAYDMRAFLDPRRLTMVMWDQAFLLRHRPDEAFGDWARVLDETVERGYNTLRIDPMPQCIDLAQPDRELSWKAGQGPYMPWCWVHPITCPAGRWLLDFMQQAVQRGLWLTLSTWWFTSENQPAETIIPRSTLEGAELWAKLLRVIEREVGFERIVYVDYANEMPYFFPAFMQQLNAVQTRDGASPSAPYTPEAAAWLREQLDAPLFALQREFPGLRFTHSIHGDPRWVEVGLKSFDCLDAHFYSDADPRWRERTRFGDLTRDGRMFLDTGFYKEFSERCAATYKAIGPMMHAYQRERIRAFADWSQAAGLPLTCTEGWSSWFYVDHPDLDWGWLLDYSERAIDDAIEFGFWGVTPHNYAQPHFANWRDVRYHRRLNEKFLAS